MGIEIEGVWISRPNTPAPGSPILAPQKSRAPSIAPSIIGGASISSLRTTGNRPQYSHPDEIQIEHNPRHSLSLAKTTRAPSITLESFLPFGRESFDLPLEYPSSELDSSGAYSSTLDALEGRGRSWGKRCKDSLQGNKTYTDFLQHQKTVDDRDKSHVLSFPYLIMPNRYETVVQVHQP